MATTEGETTDRQPLARLLGIEIVEAHADRVLARLTVREDICTSGGILHGGAFMALADTAGAIGASSHAPDLLEEPEDFDLARQNGG